jgi:hypothetical protein
MAVNVCVCLVISRYDKSRVCHRALCAICSSLKRRRHQCEHIEQIEQKETELLIAMNRAGYR